jgi:hypothetical protein
MNETNTIIADFLAQLSAMIECEFKLDENNRCQFKSGDISFVMDAPSETSKIYLTAPLISISTLDWSRDEFLKLLTINTDYSMTKGSIIGYDSTFDTLTLTIIFSSDGLDFTSFYDALTGFESIITVVKENIDTLHTTSGNQLTREKNLTHNIFA